MNNDLLVLHHKGKKVTTLVGTPIFSNSYDFMFFPERYIPAGYDHRPDLISNLFLDSPNGWKYIMLINGLSDPFESLNVGDRISIPT